MGKKKVTGNRKGAVKKPRRKGINSGANLEQRQAMKFKLGSLFRTVLSTFKEINDNRVNRKLVSDPIFIEDFLKSENVYNKEKREVSSEDLGVLRKVERELLNAKRSLNDILKEEQPTEQLNKKPRRFRKEN